MNKKMINYTCSDTLQKGAQIPFNNLLANFPKVTLLRDFLFIHILIILLFAFLYIVNKDIMPNWQLFNTVY